MSTARLQPIAKRTLGNTSLGRPLAKGSPGPSLQKLTDAIEKRLLVWAKNDTHARVSPPPRSRAPSTSCPPPADAKRSRA